MDFHPHTFLGTTQSLCPDCLALIPAKIIARNNRVYFRKRCPNHGLREDFVCSDVRWFDRLEYSLPGRVPARMAIEPERGCPYDCGLCTEHEQHTCIGLLEITSACNLECPLCYAASSPRGRHLPLDDCLAAIDHLVAAEGRAEVLQLSGGEPTIHPQFLDIFRAACERPIDIVMINTNGIRFARDPEFLAEVARWRHRCEVYLQFDGFDDEVSGALRGESLVATKLRAIEQLGAAGVRVILVCTLQGGVNEHEIGRIYQYGVQRPWITGVSFQPATYVGRYVLPEQLERRVTFPDVIRELAHQTGTWRETDFMPLPCAHPNGHSLAYAYRAPATTVPLARFIDMENHLDLLANGITFTRGQARKLISELISRTACGGDCGCGPEIVPFETAPSRALGQPGTSVRMSSGDAPRDRLTASSLTPELVTIANEFFSRAIAEDLSPADVFRITTTSFMDAYNFDVRQVMKSCVHQVLPTGHLIPFSAYNLLYRDGHVPLPPLRRPAQVVSEG